MLESGPVVEGVGVRETVSERHASMLGVTIGDIHCKGDMSLPVLGINR